MSPYTHNTHRSSTLSTLKLHVDHPCPTTGTPLSAGVHQPKRPSLLNDVASHKAKGLSGHLTAVAIATGTHTRPLGTLVQPSEVKGPASWLRGEDKNLHKIWIWVEILACPIKLKALSLSLSTHLQPPMTYS